MQASGRESHPIVIVGAGIIGAAIAYNLAKLGASVTVIEKSTPASGATAASFAWIGRPGGQDRIDASTPLRQHVLDDWESLSAELPSVVVQWTGAILWHDSYLTGDYTPISGEQEFLDEHGVAKREPSLRTLPQVALHNLRDGAVDAVTVTEALLEGARNFGATILTGTKVHGLVVDEQGGAAVECSRGRLPAWSVVIAAGTDAPKLLEPLGISIPIYSSPALMMKFAGPPELIRTIIWSNTLEARQNADGLLLVPCEHHGEQSDEELDNTAEQMRQQIARTFVVEPDDLKLISVEIGHRPMPADGMPLIGKLSALRDVYVAVMHSGLSLAPTVGRLVAMELIDGIEADELHTLRPDRSN